jgi:hypothetical protein
MPQRVSKNFRNFLSIFHAFKTNSRFSEIIFAFKIISENKNPTLSYLAEPSPKARPATRAGPASRPAEAHLGPAEPDRPQRSWPSQHGRRRRRWLPRQARPRPLKPRPSPARAPCFFRRHPCLASALCSRAAPPSRSAELAIGPRLDSAHGSAVGVNQRHHETSTAMPSWTPSSAFRRRKSAGTPPPMETRAGRPSFRRRRVSGRSPANPTPVRTSLWSPASPLSLALLNRVRWYPGRGRFGRPELQSAANAGANFSKIRPLPFVSNAGENFPSIPSFPSIRFVSHPSP